MFRVFIYLANYYYSTLVVSLTATPGNSIHLWWNYKVMTTQEKIIVQNYCQK